MISHDNELDVTGLASPLPILHAVRALKLMRSGQVLRVLASGRQVANDFRDYGKLSGAPVQSQMVEGEVREYLIQKR